MQRVAKKAFGLCLGKRLPQYEGTQVLRGPSAPVTIKRDGFAVPHIYADSRTDAMFALGFCQGQDRSFQLELFSRVCSGRLAELAGKQALPMDRLTRRVGFMRDTQRQLEALDPELRADLEAFAEGINASRRLSPRAHEFTLLAAGEPTRWTAHQVVGMVRFVAFIHSMSWDTQLARLRLLLQDGKDALLAVEAGSAPADPVSVPPGAPFGKAVQSLAEEIALFEGWLGKGGASNNWAIGAARTKSGRPLVANDPHLDPSLPSQFYLAHLNAPDFQVAGAAFVGAPGFAAGHNGILAWGVTNGKADAARLYLEHLSADQKRARVGDGWEPCEVQVETIQVRLGKPVTERIVITPRGAIITPALEGVEHALSFAATWLHPRPLRGFLTAPRAKDASSFREQFSDWPCAPINVVYADVHDTVGFQLIGQLPAQAQDYGRLPGVPSKESFQSLLPFDELPHFEGGPDDALGTANNPPAPGTAHPLLGLHWTAGYRARRIYQAFQEQPDGWDVEACLKLQMDLLALPWLEVRDTVLALDPTSEDIAQALALLGAWDGRLEARSAAAAVYQLFMDEMARRAIGAKAPRSLVEAKGQSLHRLSPFTNFAMTRLSHTVQLLNTRPQGWFADGWEAQMEQALSGAIQTLRRRLGKDSSRWGWGRLRPMRFQHLLKQRWLGPVFDLGPFEWGGDTTTLNMCTNQPADLTQNPLVAPCMRMVVEVGDWDSARFVLNGGQSGNPCSPHYDDMFQLWLGGQAPALAWSDQAVEKATAYRLQLVPMAARQAPAADQGLRLTG